MAFSLLRKSFIPHDPPPFWMVPLPIASSETPTIQLSYIGPFPGSWAPPLQVLFLWFINIFKILLSLKKITSVPISESPSESISFPPSAPKWSNIYHQLVRYLGSLMMSYHFKMQLVFFSLLLLYDHSVARDTTLLCLATSFQLCFFSWPRQRFLFLIDLS